MKLPDIPAIAIGGFGLLCLAGRVEVPAFITGLIDSEPFSSFLPEFAKYPEATQICLYLLFGTLLLSGILRIWVEADTARFLWGAGSGAGAVLLMIMLNTTVFGWAWECELYSANSSEVILTIFHFIWLFLCPFAAFYAACMMSDECGMALPEPLCTAAMPFWVIPVAAIGGFVASLVPFALICVALIPLNYLFLAVDSLVLGLIFAIGLIVVIVIL